MINKKISILFAVFFLLNSCSFDSKTGIWGDAAKEKKKIVKSEDPVLRKIDTPKRKVTAPSQVPKPPINKKIFHGKPVAIDVKDLSKGIINPAHKFIINLLPISSKYIFSCS